MFERIFGSEITAKELQNKKTIMPTDKVEMYRRDFLERHNEAVSMDISNLSAVITAFNGKRVTVWHCCNHDGYGYYTVSDGKRKRYVSSEYDLECVGGCWSMHVYERLYFAQEYLTKFLKAIKAEICRKFFVDMPLKSLYIAYILTDLDKEEKEFESLNYPFDEGDKRNYEIAREHQSKFVKKRAKEIEKYNKAVQNGSDYWDYYNGTDNHEYSCVSDILDKAMSEIYKSREQLEACELWQEAREIISVLQNTKTTLYSSRQKPIIQTEIKNRKK
ncbi:MAG: hypothetical protein K2I06_11320 [Ruminococcus sp.]|nr:hypothetical protein [Ruminococcus sp.]